MSDTPPVQKYTVKETGTEVIWAPVQNTLLTHRRSFAEKWQQNAEQADTITEGSQDNARRTAHNLPEITIGSNVAIQDPRTKLWDMYGVVRYIGPYQQYHIRTKEGRILMRNRCFICRRTPASIPLKNQPQPSQGLLCLDDLDVQGDYQVA